MPTNEASPQVFASPQATAPLKLLVPRGPLRKVAARKSPRRPLPRDEAAGTGKPVKAGRDRLIGVAFFGAAGVRSISYGLERLLGGPRGKPDDLACLVRHLRRECARKIILQLDNL